MNLTHEEVEELITCADDIISYASMTRYEREALADSMKRFDELVSKFRGEK